MTLRRQGLILPGVLVAALVVVAMLDVLVPSFARTHPLPAGSELLWWTALSAGTAMVASGALVRDRHPNLGTTALVTGALLALIATSWTLVLPALELVVVASALRDHAHRQPAY